eukprot:10768332-Alexandrium_andersonii.AAC.1
MSASLVGSEMCIRDSLMPVGVGKDNSRVRGGAVAPSVRPPAPEAPVREAVSYTHLTLPTICSV